MDAENIINVFSTRVRQLILLVKDLKKENAELHALVDQRDSQIMELNEKIVQLDKDYNNMMMAKMLNISDANIEETKRRINRLIMSVDRCITLMGDMKK